MKLETMGERDIANFRRLQPYGWPDIAPEFEYYIDTPFCYPVMVLIRKRIVGVGSGISLGNTAWLAHIIVDKGFRRRGIGRFIIDELLNLMADGGCKSVSLIATELGYRVYKKAGFAEQTEYLFFERPKPLPACSRSENIVLLTEEDAQAVLSLDRRVSGEQRQSLLSPVLDKCYGYKKAGRVRGYYLPAMGEGPIISEDAEAGIALMRFKYAACNMGVVPVDNEAGVAFFKENGFSEVRRAKRMIWGQAFPWQPQKVFGRIGGNLG